LNAPDVLEVARLKKGFKGVFLINWLVSMAFYCSKLNVIIRWSGSKKVQEVLTSDVTYCP